MLGVEEKGLKGDKMEKDLMKELGKETRGHIVNEETDDQYAMEEARSNLEEAREHLQEAYDTVKFVIADLPQKGSIQAYFLDKLKIMIGEDHGFMTEDPNIDTIIADMEEELGPDKEDDADESIASAEANEKPTFEPGEKVMNDVGEILVVVKKDGDDVYVEEQPNKAYKASELVKYIRKEEVVHDEDTTE